MNKLEELDAYIEKKFGRYIVVTSDSKGIFLGECGVIAKGSVFNLLAMANKMIKTIREFLYKQMPKELADKLLSSLILTDEQIKDELKKKFLGNYDIDEEEDDDDDAEDEQCGCDDDATDEDADNTKAVDEAFENLFKALRDAHSTGDCKCNRHNANRSDD